jgi:hypothetical protein
MSTKCSLRRSAKCTRTINDKEQLLVAAGIFLIMLMAAPVQALADGSTVLMRRVE